MTTEAIQSIIRITHPLEQGFIQGMAFVAKELDRPFRLGDVCVDEKGKAFTHFIMPDGTLTRKTFTAKFREGFEQARSEDFQVASEFMKQYSEGMNNG